MLFHVNQTDPNADIVIEQTELKKGITNLKVKMTSPLPTTPTSFSVQWSFPAVDCYSIFSPSTNVPEYILPNWSGRKATPSRLAENMPLHSIVSHNGTNRMTIAVSDAVTPLSISTGVSEETACFDCKVTFFTIPVSPLQEYTAIIRIDLRNIPCYDSICDIVNWWENECGYLPAKVPEHARLPINSLWYSYHQQLNPEDILKECRLSKEYGMETVIIDDGWQTDDTNRGYAFCGDWKVASGKIPDMRHFVQQIHDTGMKVILWYSVPFIGKNSENYHRFKEMILDGTEKRNSYWALDPRYPEVRYFLVDTYVRAVTDWNLDGLKLDFINSFVLKGKSIPCDPRRDYESLEAAVDVLMSEVYSSLTKINPDILIEFRQPYVGPAIRKYGNMLRVGDCPNDAIRNRKNTIKLRLTSGKTAVHSDMLMWNVNDPVEHAALQLVSSLYSVPQISMKIAALNDEHRRMLKYYLSFWRAHRDVLLDGKLIANNHESHFSLVRAQKNRCEIVTAYTDRIIRQGEYINHTIVINASSEKELFLENMVGKSYRVINCMGDVLAKSTIHDSIKAITVPLCGMIEIE